MAITKESLINAYLDANQYSELLYIKIIEVYGSKDNIPEELLSNVSRVFNTVNQINTANLTNELKDYTTKQAATYFYSDLAIVNVVKLDKNLTDLAKAITEYNHKATLQQASFLLSFTREQGLAIQKTTHALNLIKQALKQPDEPGDKKEKPTTPTTSNGSTTKPSNKTEGANEVISELNDFVAISEQTLECINKVANYLSAHKLPILQTNLTDEINNNLTRLKTNVSNVKTGLSNITSDLKAKSYDSYTQHVNNQIKLLNDILVLSNITIDKLNETGYDAQGTELQLCISNIVNIKFSLSSLANKLNQTVETKPIDNSDSKPEDTKPKEVEVKKAPVLPTDSWGVKFSYIDQASEKVWYLSLLPAMRSTIPLQGGSDTPGAMPGLNFKFNSNITKHKIVGFQPIYQHLGVDSITCTMVGFFTGADGETPGTSKLSNDVRNRNASNNVSNTLFTPYEQLINAGGSLNIGQIAAELDSYRDFQSFVSFAVQKARELTIDINIARNTQVSNLSGESGFLRDGTTGNPRFKGIIKRMDVYHARQDRTWYIMDIEITDSGLTKGECINLTNDIEKILEEKGINDIDSKDDIKTDFECDDPAPVCYEISKGNIIGENKRYLCYHSITGQPYLQISKSNQTGEETKEVLEKYSPSQFALKILESSIISESSTPVSKLDPSILLKLDIPDPSYQFASRVLDPTFNAGKRYLGINGSNKIDILYKYLKTITIEPRGPAPKIDGSTNYEEDLSREVLGSGDNYNLTIDRSGWGIETYINGPSLPGSIAIFGSKRKVSPPIHPKELVEILRNPSTRRTGFGAIYPNFKTGDDYKLLINSCNLNLTPCKKSTTSPKGSESPSNPAPTKPTSDVGKHMNVFEAIKAVLDEPGENWSLGAGIVAAIGCAATILAAILTLVLAAEVIAGLSLVGTLEATGAATIPSAAWPSIVARVTTIAGRGAPNISIQSLTTLVKFFSKGVTGLAAPGGPAVFAPVVQDLIRKFALAEGVGFALAALASCGISANLFTHFIERVIHKMQGKG